MVTFDTKVGARCLAEGTINDVVKAARLVHDCGVNMRGDFAGRYGEREKKRGTKEALCSLAGQLTASLSSVTRS